MLDEFVADLQENALPGPWSQGVSLARTPQSFELLSQNDKECVFSVRVPGRPLPLKVTLWPSDRDSDCDCDARVMPCAHVIGAALILKQGKVSAATSTRAFLYYDLKHLTDSNLGLERRWVDKDRSGLITSTLLQHQSAQQSGRSAGPELAITGADFRLDQALQSYRGGPLTRHHWEAVFRCYEPEMKFRLNGELVSLSSQPVDFVVECVDEADGYRLKQQATPNLTKTFANGVALLGTQMRLLSRFNPQSTTARYCVGHGTYFSPQQESELVGKILPQVSKEYRFENKSLKLPVALDLEPQIEVMFHWEAPDWLVTPRLVYGDPPRFVWDSLRNELRAMDASRSRAQAVCRRQELRERDLHVELRNHFQMQVGQGRRMGPIEAAEKWRLAQSRGFRVVGDAESLLKADDVGLSFDWGLSDLRIAPCFKSGSSELPFSKAWEAFVQGQTQVALLDGRVAALPRDWMQRFGQQLKSYLDLRDSNKELSAVEVSELIQFNQDLGLSDLSHLKEQFRGFEGLEDCPLPPDLTAKLRDYQVRGYQWLKFLQFSGLGALLCDDMGLGKTLQSICAIEGRTLVVAPTSVLFNWEREIKRFRPGLKVHVYYGPDRHWREDNDVVLTSYALLRMELPRFVQSFWDCFVLDEAQNIKNPHSQAAQAAFQVPASFRLALTGTPVENKLEDLWSQMHFANPELLGSEREFQERFAKPIGSGDADRALQLRRKLKPLILRRLKSDVARELPPKTEMILRADLSQQELEFYRGLESSTKRQVLEALEQSNNVIQALELLLRLRQMCCHPSLVPGFTWEETSAKLNLLMESLEEALAEGHRALVFSQWTSFLDLIGQEISRRGKKFLRLDGSTPNRGEIVERFQSRSGGEDIMLISLKAGGVGLNLTSADHVYIMDPWWNPSVEDQAADRAYRIGQQNPVLVHKLICSGTLEERILELQNHKRGLAQAVLDGQELQSALTREDLMFLLS